MASSTSEDQGRRSAAGFRFRLRSSNTVGLPVDARINPAVSGSGRARGLASGPGGHASHMSVTAFQDLPLADRDREWDGDAADKRVRKWAGAEDEPNQKYRDAHVWFDGENKDNFTAYKLLIADVVGGKLEAVPRG